jgi:cell division protein FtsI (penicillin-binding protein 3)
VAKKSGIDLSRDLPGSLKPVHILEHKMHRANSAFGYGMMVTFAQLFKAYSAFNNDGIAVTPRIVSYLGDGKGKQYTLKPKVGNIKAVSKKSAHQIHDILLEVVKRGTGKKALYPGLEIGGKTGTAHIAKNGRYVREYHSSFYGFANDKEGNKYTIGVLVIRAKKWHKYFASQSAVPTFKNITKILVEQGYLKPDPKEMMKEEEDSQLYKTEKETISTPVIKKPTKKIKKVLKKKEVIKKKSVKSLFNIKKKPKKKVHKKRKPKVNIKVKSKAKPIKKKPAKKKSANELFEDLF